MKDAVESGASRLPGFVDQVDGEHGVTLGQGPGGRSIGLLELYRDESVAESFPEQREALCRDERVVLETKAHDLQFVTRAASRDGIELLLGAIDGTPPTRTERERQGRL